ALGAGQTGGEDVRAEQDLFVFEARGDQRKVCAGVGDEQVLSPCPVDGIPEAPTADSSTALRVHAVQAVKALSAWRDRANDHTLSHAVVRLEPGTELFDDANRLVTQDQTRLHRVLAADDVYVGPADRRGRDPDDGFSRTRRRLGNLFYGNTVLSFE